MVVSVRVFLGLVLVLAGLGFGFTARSPIVIAPLAAIFTLSFALGRWRAWQGALRSGQVAAALRAQWSTVLVQVLLVALLYLLGRGIGAMVAGFVPSGYSSVDSLALWGIAIVVLCGGAGLAMLEAQAPSPARAEASDKLRADQPKTAFVPVTEDTFFKAHHYSNIAGGTGEARLPDPKRAFVTEADIADVETRLEARFPPRLRALYLRQNGGYLGGLVAPRVADPDPTKEDDWITPFSGYSDLSPLGYVRSLKTSIEDYADPDYQPEMFPAGAGRMIILAQWYRHTLFLDYRNGEPPRVGFFDFDRSDDLRDPEWQDRAVWWTDFDAFFASLHRPTEE